MTEQQSSPVAVESKKPKPKPTKLDSLMASTGRSKNVCKAMLKKMAGVEDKIIKPGDSKSAGEAVKKYNERMKASVDDGKTNGDERPSG